ncbi:MAG: AtpZ/AtpI family protein [Chloroflexi bacterium]|nr:AtpZ/AtpI family protein [Chloroflexota bacterium]
MSQQWWVWTLKFMGVGWYVALSIVLGTALGLWGDSAWGTKPWLSLLGATLGTVVAIYGVYKMLAPGLRPPKDKNGSKVK